MSNKKGRRQRQLSRQHRKQQQRTRFVFITAICLSVVTCVGIVIGPWRSSIGAGGFRALFAAPVPTPTVAPPSDPSREYIYAGGRMVATEDTEPGNPALNRPTNFSLLIWCQAHASWTDNSNNETTFKVELSTDAGLTFSVYETVPANSTQALFLPKPGSKDQTFVYRVRASNAQGDSGPSNSVSIPPPVPCDGGCLCPDGAPGLEQTIWVDENIPTGGLPAGEESWNWVSENPGPFSRELSSQSLTQAGFHQHYFSGATQTLAVAQADWLMGYVYLDPAAPPSEVMLQWNDGGGWEHRAYWGANAITAGVDGTNSRRYMGVLPQTGQWARLEVPAAQVGLGGATLSGLALTLYDGRATWDSLGRADRSLSALNQPAPTNLMATTLSASQVNVSWNATVDAQHYEVQRSQNFSSGFSTIAANVTATSFLDSVQAGTAYLYRVRAVTVAGAPSPYSNVDLAIGMAFTDDPLIAGATPIKAQHVLELRQATNAIRALANLGAAGWTDNSLPGVTVKAVHIQEVRINLDGALSALGLPLFQYTNTSLQGIPIKLIHVEEIRQRMK